MSLSPRPVMREWIAQRTDKQFLDLALPPDAYFTAIDHARSMTKAAGRRRKERGVRAGIPDWLIVWHGIALWIERKEGTDLSPAQEKTRDMLLANGHQWALCRSTEEVEAALRSAGIPLRASYSPRTLSPDKPRPRARKTKQEPRYTLSKRAVAKAAKAGIRV